ncbi:MAG: hypothetical protein WC203_07480 [Candidatus Bathyarchaeia archaeon]|jgi:hypothetical protein|nr:hypothetical protein [Thermoproteota archaeon]NLD66318.1 hypothetical protein [Thermoproteota archaeon]
MERQQAVSVVKEIFECCRFIEGKNIKLMPPNADDVLSKGCQIHIDAKDDDILMDCLEKVAIGNELAMVKEGQLVILYKPLVKLG